MLRFLSKALLICSILISSISHAAETKVINLKYRKATEIEQLIKAFIEKEDVLQVSSHNQLVIKTSKDNLKTITNLIDVLDIEIKQLIIEVNFGELTSKESRSYSTKRRKRKGFNIRVQDGQMAKIQQDKIVPLKKSVYGHKQDYKENDYHALDSTMTTALADLSTTIADKEKAIIAQEKVISNLRDPTSTTFIEQGIPNPGTQQGTTLNTALETANITLNDLQKDLEGLRNKEQTLKSQFDNLLSEKIDINTQSGLVQYEFANLTTGLYVKPRLINNNQNIELEIIHIESDVDLKEIRSSNTIETKINAQINQWVNISNNSGSSIKTKSRSFSSSSRSITDNSSIWLKVDIAP